MIDLKAARRDPAPVARALARRKDGSDERLMLALSLYERRNALRAELDALRAIQKRFRP